MIAISKEDVKRLLPAKAAIDIVARAYSELSNGTAVVPDRLGIESRGENGVSLIMPGYLSEADSLAVKIVSVFKENAEKGLPAIHGLVIVFDPSSGKPLAIIEGAYLTALRTGASCGLATKHFAQKGATTLAMIGLGAQSRSIVPAVCAVRDIERVFVFDVDPEAAGVFSDEMSMELEGSIEKINAPDANTAIADADIVCTATTSSSPVFDGAKLKEGSHINGIGSFTPEMCEIGPETIQRCGKIVVDSFEGAMAEAGDLIQAIDQGVISRESIHGEIGEIVEGSKAGRENDSEITFFKSVGNAALDVAVGAAVFNKAVESGAGVTIDLL